MITQEKLLKRKSNEGSISRIIQDIISVSAGNALFSFASWAQQDSGCQPLLTFPVQVRCSHVMLQYCGLISNMAFTTLFVPLLYPHHYTVRAGTVL